MQRHVVQPGDTLWQIARHYLGDARQWRSIALANGIGLDAVIVVGQRLVIPPLEPGAGRDPAAHWPSSLGGGGTSDESNTSVLPAQGFHFILADEINPLTRKVVRKVMINPSMAEEIFGKTGRIIQTVPNPERFGLFPTDINSPVSLGRHAMGMKPSAFSSASDHALGASRMTGSRFFIDVDKAQAAGARVHETKEILADLERIKAKLVKPADIGRLNKVVDLVRLDAEVAIEGNVPRSAIKGSGAMATTRALQGFQIIGFAVAVHDLSNAARKSAEKGSVKPISAEVVRQAGGWAAAVAGMKLGGATGAAFGITTGPGAIVTGAAGAFIGGVAGYYGFDWIADHIDEN